MRRPAAVLSVAIHAVVVLVLLTIGFQPAIRMRVASEATRLFLPAPMRALSKDGGGGQRQPLPARKGAAPVVVHRTFVPPMPVVKEDPKLVLEISLEEAPEIN